jgi:membrane-associated phospholipid phosphatase
MTVETLPSAAPAGRGYTLARIISNTLHPMTLGILSFLVIGYHALPQHRLAGLTWAVFGIICQIIPGILFFTIRMRQGAYTDEDVSVRSQRNELYFFSLVILLVNLPLLAWLHAPIDFLVLVLSTLLISLMAWVINLFWKISVHASSAASCATIAIFYQPVLGVLLWAGALSVGWARVRTRNHTPLQVAAGFVLASLCVWGMFTAFGLR